MCGNLCVAAGLGARGLGGVPIVGCRSRSALSHKTKLDPKKSSSQRRYEARPRIPRRQRACDYIPGLILLLLK